MAPSSHIMAPSKYVNQDIKRCSGLHQTIEPKRHLKRCIYLLCSASNLWKLERKFEKMELSIILQKREYLCFDQENPRQNFLLLRNFVPLGSCHAQQHINPKHKTSIIFWTKRKQGESCPCTSKGWIFFPKFVIFPAPFDRLDLHKVQIAKLLGRDAFHAPGR